MSENSFEILEVGKDDRKLIFKLSGKMSEITCSTVDADFDELFRISKF